MWERLVLAMVIAGFSATAVPDSLEDMRARGMQCVEPVEVMRKQHMELLLHQRDLTMHKGIRTQQHSLVQCVECHVQTDSKGAYIAINEQEQFCADCHAFTSVSIDCFECHATKPDTPVSAGIRKDPQEENLASEIAQHLARPAGLSE